MSFARPVRLCFLLAILVHSATRATAQASCIQPPVPTIVTESSSQIVVSITGGVVETCVFAVLAGTDWSVDLSISTTEAIADKLCVDGTVRHENAPHGEGMNSSALPISVAIDAGNFGAGNQVVSFDAMISHGSHLDVLTGNVDFFVFVELIFGFHFIVSYSVDFTVNHGLPATSLVRNGKGINPMGFTELSPAIVGTNWNTTVALSAAEDLSIVAIGLGGPTQGILLEGHVRGEPLCLGPFLTDIARGVHSIPVPNDPSLIGATFCAQAARVGPGRQVILNNAIDVTVGTF